MAPNQIVIVTGGASGVGEATARRFRAAGATVVIGDVNPDRGTAVASETGAEFVRCDVSNEEDLAHLVGHTVATHGRVDVMVNNAGVVGPRGSITATAAADLDNAVAIMLRGPFLGIKYTAPHMSRQGGGSIISTASAVAGRAGSGPHVYSMCKAALVHLTATASAELGRHGVRVNCVSPGHVPTNISGPRAPDSVSAITLFEEIFRPAQHLKRRGAVDDIANAITWLASDEASFITGHNLVVDGGYSHGAPVDSVIGL